MPGIGDYSPGSNLGWMRLIPAYKERFQGGTESLHVPAIALPGRGVKPVSKQTKTRQTQMRQKATEKNRISRQATKQKRRNIREARGDRRHALTTQAIMSSRRGICNINNTSCSSNTRSF